MYMEVATISQQPYSVWSFIKKNYTWITKLELGGSGGE